MVLFLKIWVCLKITTISLKLFSTILKIGLSYTYFKITYLFTFLKHFSLLCSSYFLLNTPKSHRKTTYTTC